MIHITRDFESGTAGSMDASRVQSLTSLLNRYASSAAPTVPIGSLEFISAFVEATGSQKSFVDYRAVLRHFLRWTAWNGVPTETFGIAVLEDFRFHHCTAPYRKTSPVKNDDIGRIARFIVYLQYQDRAPSYGWTRNDTQLCEDFRRALLSEGVSTASAEQSALHAMHFIVWLRLSRIEKTALDDTVVERFARHLCGCGVHGKPGKKALMMNRRRVSVRRFLRFIEGEQVVLSDGVMRRHRRPSTTRRLESAVHYEEWLRDERGLAQTSITSYLLDLAIWLPQVGEDASLYTAARVRDAAMNGSDKRSPFMQGRVVRSIRSYLSFCAAKGRCSPNLAGSLISRPVYRLGSIPRHTNSAEVARVISSCNLKTGVGIRERAILLLLAELGLRAIEVWRLHLDDLNWDTAEITIRGKGGRGATMPLTQSAGDALLEYLDNARPKSIQSAIFLRVEHPHVPLASAAEISNIARKALRRCGIIGLGGSHVFRHTLATGLLRAGNDLQDVATVLRHRSLDSTAIYAKVDETMLRLVTQPWIGGSND